ncbi:hypothetical protein [Candidatus Methanomassiliicoccus intestinalis]|uniref:hypothetical protein n=1 Tax=Candidatus Methanomassiliicoccus intestinalis TaxID=1406512 RepID=UPI0037DD0E77
MMKDKRRLFVSFALIVALCMFAATVATPVFLDDADSAYDQEIVLSGIFDGHVDLIDALVMMCPIVGLTWNIAEYYNQGSPGGGGSSDPDQIAKDTRAHESEIVYTILAKNAELLANSISGYGDIWKFTNNYWMRQAEVAAAERWASTSQYSASYILERSGLIGNLAKLFENVEEGPDATFDLLNDRLAVWKNTSGYSQMSIVVQYGNNTITDLSNLDIKLRNMINVTSQSANVAYLDARELWVSNGNAKIYAENGTEYQLSSGYNNLASMGIESGLYAFQVGHAYAGSIIPIIASSAASVNTGIVLESGNTFKIAQYYNNQVLIDNVNYVDLSLYVDTGDGAVSSSIDVMPMLSMHKALLDETYKSLTKSHVAAQAAWKIFDVAQESNILLSPSSLVPNLGDIQVSSEELYTLTVLYLAQITDYYERANGNLTKTGFNISPDSLDLYIRGNIYDQNGTLIYESVVFTPYVWLDSMDILEGTNNFTQSGYIAVWGESDNIRNWSVASGYAPQLISVSSGYSFYAAQIMHHDRLVSSVALDVLEVEQWNEIEVVPGPVPQPIPHVVDLAPYIMWILIEAAVIWFLLWDLLKMENLILLLPAVVLLLLGLFGADWIAGMV